jgi:hypothetical protein
MMMPICHQTISVFFDTGTASWLHLWGLEEPNTTQNEKNQVVQSFVGCGHSVAYGGMYVVLQITQNVFVYKRLSF